MSEELWQGGAWEQPARPVQPLVLPTVRKKRRRPTPRKNWILFFAALLLIVALTVVVAFVSQMQFYYVEYPFEDTVEQETTIPRGGIGSEVRLELQEPGEQILDRQEIYNQCNPWVVYIRSINAQGRAGGGSGVIMSEDGYIITNAHVIDGTQRVQVIFQDNTVKEAVLVGAHEDYDLAVLKVEAENLPCARFAVSAYLRVGDPVVALGNPLGSRLRGTMTEGIVSALDRSVDLDGVTMSLIQTTAALNPGNSGGALINDRGQVVGITTMKMMSRYSTIEGLSFAIPSRLVKKVVDQLIATGEAKSPALGIVVRFDYANGGLYVQGVNKTSDAWAKGLRPEDVIVAINGEPVTDDRVLIVAKEELGVGESLTLTVERAGERLELVVELMDAALFEQEKEG